jgi:hypothetical protein
MCDLEPLASPYSFPALHLEYLAQTWIGFIALGRLLDLNAIPLRFATIR